MPFVKLPPLSPELHALMLEVRAALEGAEVGKPAPMPPGLMQRIEDRMREEALARRRLEWLHSSESSNVDGWEWGIYRLRWLNNGAGSVAEVQQTLNDFSDLEAAMANHSGVPASQAPSFNVMTWSCPYCHAVPGSRHAANCTAYGVRVEGGTSNE